MEFTWVKTCAAKKYTFLRAHFWSPGTAYLKCTCPKVYFLCFGDVYVWIFLVYFRCIFLLKSVFFFTLLVPVSRRGVFFFTPWAPLSCAGVFLLHLCENRTCAFTAGVFSYPRVVHFFWQAGFLDTSCGNKKRIFAASVFWQHMFS